jgi:hypothetical protein
MLPIRPSRGKRIPPQSNQSASSHAEQGQTVARERGGNTRINHGAGERNDNTIAKRSTGPQQEANGDTRHRQGRTARRGAPQPFSDSFLVQPVTTSSRVFHHPLWIEEYETNSPLTYAGTFPPPDTPVIRPHRSRAQTKPTYGRVADSVSSLELDPKSRGGSPKEDGESSIILIMEQILIALDRT